MINPKNIVAAQLLYLGHLNSLKSRVTGVVKQGAKNSNLEQAAYSTLDEINKEVDEIEGCLKLLTYLQKSG